jgi:hypothetical protein
MVASSEGGMQQVNGIKRVSSFTPSPALCYTLPHKRCSVYSLVWLSSMTLHLNRLSRATKWLLRNSIRLLVLRCVQTINQSDAVAALALGFLSGLQTAKEDSR